MATLQSVEIFAPGHWFPSNGPKKGVKFTKDLVKRILQNTQDLLNKAKINPRLKLGHEDQFLKGDTDGKPLFGSADNFKLKGSKIIADFKNIPKWLFDAIKRKQLTNLSIEINGTSNKNAFISAVALLGVSNPAVKSIKDLQAYLSEKGASVDTLNFTVLSWDETENQHRARMQNPDDFQEDTFRTKDLEGVQGIQIVVGRLKPDKVPEGGNPESAVIQAYRFNKEFWTLAQAKQWLSEQSEQKIVFKFSEPFFNQNFKEEIMGDQETKAISPEQHAEILAENKDLIAKFAAQEKQTSELQKTLDEFKAKFAEQEGEESEKEKTELQAKLDEAQEKLAGFSEKEKELEEAEKKLADFAVKEQEIKFASQKVDILKPYQDDVKEGKLAPSILKEIDTHIEGQKVLFSEGKDLSISAQLTHKIAKAYSGALPMGEQSEDESEEDSSELKFSNISEEVAYEVAKIQAKNANLDYGGSLSLLFQSKPNMEKKYHQWTLGFAS